MRISFCCILLIGCIFLCSVLQCQGNFYPELKPQSVPRHWPPPEQPVVTESLSGETADTKEEDDLLDMIEDSPATPILLVIFSSLCMYRVIDDGEFWFLFASAGYTFAWLLYDFGTSSLIKKGLMGGTLIWMGWGLVVEALAKHRHRDDVFAYQVILCALALFHFVWARLVFTFEPSIYEYPPLQPPTTKLFQWFHSWNHRKAEPAESLDQNAQPAPRNTRGWFHPSQKTFAVETTPEPLEPKEPDTPDRTGQFLGWLEKELNKWASRVKNIRSARAKKDLQEKDS